MKLGDKADLANNDWLLQEAMDLDPYCGAMKKNGEPCKQKALYNGRRCKFHGGLSTGPTSEKGKAQSRINGAKGGRPRQKQSQDNRLSEIQSTLATLLRLTERRESYERHTGTEQQLDRLLLTIKALKSTGIK